MSTAWQAQGEYMEACSCDFLCPCIPKNSTTPATHDFCKVALAFDISAGKFGDTDLAGVKFVMVAQSEAIMSTGNWIAGLIVDKSATDDQVNAVIAITGEAGNGPLGKFAPLITDFRGLERHDIKFDHDGGNCHVVVGGLIDQQIVGVDSVSVPGEYVCIDNSSHPVNKRLNFASAMRNIIRAFGIEWEETTGRTNGHFASFDWQGEAA